MYLQHGNLCRQRFRHAPGFARKRQAKSKSQTSTQPQPSTVASSSGGYDVKKFLRELERTYLVLESQYRRFSHNNKRGNAILIYYSLGLIFYSIAIVFFKGILCVKLLEFSSIMLSIGALVYSLINGNANYLSRSLKIEDTLEEVRGIISQAEELLHVNINFQPPQQCIPQNCAYNANHPYCAYSVPCKKLQALKEQYRAITEKCHLADCSDLYYMAKSLCTRYGPFDSEQTQGKAKQNTGVNKKRIKIATSRYSVKNIMDLFKTDFGDCANEEKKAVYYDLKKVIHPYTIMQQRFFEIRARIWHLVLYITPTALLLFAFIIKVAGEGYLGDWVGFNWLKTLNTMFGG